MVCANLAGENEAATLCHHLGWMAGWASGMARDLMTIEETLTSITGGISINLHRNWGPEDKLSKEQLCARIDGISVLVCGLLRTIQHAYKDDEGMPMLAGLVRQFESCRDMADGREPIPVNSWKELSGVHEILRDSKSDFIQVRVEGNWDFFIHMNEDRVGRHLHDSIESSRRFMDARDKKKLALVFCDEETLDRLLAERLSVFQSIEKKFPGMRLFTHKDVIVEKCLPTPPLS